MNKEQLLHELQNIAIADVILEGNSQNPPYHIQTIITVDGYHINLQTGEKNHPAYEKELAEFTARVSQMTYNETFSFRSLYLSRDEMQRIAQERSKMINANPGNVGSGYHHDEYHIRMGEDLTTLRR